MKTLSLLPPIKRLHRDRGGNFSMLFGVSALAIMMSAGIAVEFTRAMSEKSAMSNALDAAVLATARAISSGDLTLDDPEETEEYLHAIFVANMNVPDDAAGGYRIENIQFDAATETLTASAASGFGTMFRFFGENNDLTIRTSAGATYGSSDAEIAMTFDVTTSMEGSKIGDLKAAAEAGITQLLEKNQPGNEKVRISAIPYAEAVNVGELSRYVYPDDGEPDTAPPALADYEADIEGGGGDDCSTERKGRPYMYEPVGPDIAMANRDPRLDQCPDAVLMPLTSDLDALLDAVDNFEANGHTAGQIGIQWAWYTLSPHWADFLPAGSAPTDPEDPDVDVRKYAIIMTDGEFNTAYALVEPDDDDDNHHKDQSQRSAEHAIELCMRMKAAGIEIFTIGFQLSEDDAIELMKNCASPDQGNIKFFYDASSGADLTNAYTDIASTIQALRLVR